MRADEAGRLEPSDLDLERGAVVLDDMGDFAPLDEAIPELNGRGGRLGGSDPMSAGREAGSPSPSNGASLVRALHHRAPAAVVDHAGQPAAGAPVAACGPLGPRWATPASDSAANQT